MATNNTKPTHTLRCGNIKATMMARFTGDTAEGRARVISEEPVGQMGQPEEIANAVLWLCSDVAHFVIGHAMVVAEAKRCSDIRRQPPTPRA